MRDLDFTFIETESGTVVPAAGEGSEEQCVMGAGVVCGDGKFGG